MWSFHPVPTEIEILQFADAPKQAKRDLSCQPYRLMPYSVRGFKLWRIMAKLKLDGMAGLSGCCSGRLATGGRSSTPRLSACNDTSWPSGSSGDAFLEPPTASASLPRGIQRRRISVGSWPWAVNTRRTKKMAVSTRRTDGCTAYVWIISLKNSLNLLQMLSSHHVCSSTNTPKPSPDALTNYKNL